MIKRIMVIVGATGILVLIGLLAREIRFAHYPITIEPSLEWEPYVSSLDAQRETFLVEMSDGALVETQLFIPNGGSEQKAAVVWTGGSSDGAYHDYAWELIETYVLGVFLARDMAVILTNKRGVGESEGNWYRNGIEGRADDVYSVVESFQNHPSIDNARVGVIGHSQGGWVVGLAAAEHGDIALFISLAGPTTSIWGNAEDNYYHAYSCQGYEGAELEERVEKNLRLTGVGLKLGELTRFGSWYHDVLIFSYDPADALRAVKAPGLLIYAENDDQVTPSLNLDRLDELFDGIPPDHLITVVLDDATHAFRLVDDPCESWINVPGQPHSEELVTVLNNWLEEQGY